MYFSAFLCQPPLLHVSSLVVHSLYYYYYYYVYLCMYEEAGGRGGGCLSVQLQSTLVSKVISCVGQQPKTRRQRSGSRCETMRDSRKLFHPKIKKKKIPSRCIQFKWRLLRLGYLKGNSYFILYKKATSERDQRVEMSATQKRLSHLARQTIVQSIQH